MVSTFNRLIQQVTMFEKEAAPMSEHKITLEWKRETDSFSYESYNRDHVVIFEGGVRVPASAAPAYRGNASHVNPEEALVAALSSCHMLTFLAATAKKQFVVERYLTFYNQKRPHRALDGHTPDGVYFVNLPALPTTA